MATADDLKFQGKGDVAGADAGLGPSWGSRQGLEALGAILSVRRIKTSWEFCRWGQDGGVRCPVFSEMKLCCWRPKKRSRC